MNVPSLIKLEGVQRDWKPSQTGILCEYPAVSGEISKVKKISKVRGRKVSLRFILSFGSHQGQAQSSLYDFIS